MFKRPARILLVGRKGGAVLSAVAAALPPNEEAALLEVRVLETVAAVPESELAWADLVVLVEQGFEPVPAPEVLARNGCRLRHWDLSDSDPAVLESRIADRFRSMIGGLRMLGRADPNAVNAVDASARE